MSCFFVHYINDEVLNQISKVSLICYKCKNGISHLHSIRFRHENHRWHQILVNTSTRTNDFFARSVQQKHIPLARFASLHYAFKSGPIHSATYFFPILGTNTAGFQYLIRRYLQTCLLIYLQNAEQCIHSTHVFTVHHFSMTHFLPFFLNFISFLCCQSNKYRTYKNVLAVASCVRMCLVRVFLFFTFHLFAFFNLHHHEYQASECVQ